MHTHAHAHTHTSTHTCTQHTHTHIHTHANKTNTSANVQSFQLLHVMHQYFTIIHILTTHYSAKKLCLLLCLQNPSGLGMSETMYSWSVIVYNIGYVILAAVTGVVLKFVPFLHVLSTSLLINLFGSLLYAISTNGGTVIVSRFLAGAYNGIILTASFSYISSREFDFQDAYFLKVTKEGKASSVRKKLQHHPRVKETTFSLLSFAITTSYLVGPGYTHQPQALFVSTHSLHL